MGNIGFMSPAMLWGVAAVAVPLAIHLIQRRKARRLWFPAVEFILRSQRKVARYLKWKNLILLLLRMALLALIPLAMSKPREGAVVAAGNVEPQAIVIILDASSSMTAVDGGTQLFAAAREKAAAILAGLDAGDAAGLIVAGTTLQVPFARLSFDLTLVRNQIEHAAPGPGGMALGKALSQARVLLEPSLSTRKTVYLVSDLARGNFRDLGAADTQLGANTKLVLVRVSPVLPFRNRAVTAVHTMPSPRDGPRHRRFQAEIHDYSVFEGSAPPEKTTVTMRVNGAEAATGEAELVPGASEPKTFSHAFDEAGLYRVELATEPDSYAADDVFHLWGTEARDLRILAVNGAPSTVHYRDEFFYLERALNPAKARETDLFVTYTTPDAFGSHDLAQFDVLLFANVRELPPGAPATLEAFLSRGGGLIAALGDRVDGEKFNEQFAAILPGRLRDVAGLEERGQSTMTQRALGQIDFAHPIFQAFQEADTAGLMDVLTARYFFLELPPSTAAGIRTLMSYTDGAPALVEGRTGRGRVVLFASTLDRDWNDWPVKTSFLPFVQRAVRYVAGTLTSTHQTELHPGDPLRLKFQDEAVALTVTPPGGPPVKLEAPAVAEGERFTDWTDTARLGFYAVAQVNRVGEATPDAAQSFTVNAAPEESDFASLPDGELLAKLGQGAQGDAGAAPAIAMYDPEQGPAASLWSWLLLGAIAVVLTESAVKALL